MIKIKKYPDYSVDDQGNVYSLFCLNRFGKYLRKKPYLLKHNIMPTGYETVALGSQKSGDMKRLLVHRIVAEAFIPNPENKPCVNHKNGIKSDNIIENLEWVTRSENEIHAHRTGLKNFRRNHGIKLTADIADQIRLCEGSQRFIAKKFGVSQPLVFNIKHNNIW